MSTDPTSTTTELGLRAYALGGPPANCATDGDGDYPVTYGCPVWAVALEGGAMTAPVSDDLETVVVGTDVGLVYAVSEATGAVLWTPDVGSAVTADPGIAGGTVLVPTAEDGLVAPPLAGHDGGVLAAYPVGGCGSGTCGPVWSTFVGGAFDVPMAIGSGHLLVTTDSVMHAFATQ